MRVSVDDETGTVTWPGGADLAPDTLYSRIKSGVWPDDGVAALSIRGAHIVPLAICGAEQRRRTPLIS